MVEACFSLSKSYPGIAVPSGRLTSPFGNVNIKTSKGKSWSGESTKVNFRYNDTLVQWMIHWYSEVVNLYNGTVVPWYTGTLVQWNTAAMIYTGTMVHWYDKTMI